MQQGYGRGSDGCLKVAKAVARASGAGGGGDAGHFCSASGRRREHQRVDLLPLASAFFVLQRYRWEQAIDDGTLAVLGLTQTDHTRQADQRLAASASHVAGSTEKRTGRDLSGGRRAGTRSYARVDACGLAGRGVTVS